MIAKIHIIAKDETLKAVVAVINELNAAYLRLTVKRVSLCAERTDCNSEKPDSQFRPRARPDAGIN